MGPTLNKSIGLYKLYGLESPHLILKASLFCGCNFPSFQKWGSKGFRELSKVKCPENDRDLRLSPETEILTRLYHFLVTINFKASITWWKQKWGLFSTMNQRSALKPSKTKLPTHEEFSLKLRKIFQSWKRLWSHLYD